MFRCDVHLGSNHKKAPNTWNFTISKKAQTIWQHIWGSSVCVSCAWSEPLDLSSTHTQNRLRKAIFVCVVLAESLARFLQFTRDSPQTVTEYNISYTFRHCCLIPPLMISSLISPKKSLKLYHWCCSMPEPDADAWRILKQKTSLNRFFLSCQLVHE